MTEDISGHYLGPGADSGGVLVGSEALEVVGDAVADGVHACEQGRRGGDA